jgi:hypothetical protein
LLTTGSGGPRISHFSTGKKARILLGPQQYIERLERAATVAQWPDDQRRCDEFVLSLRDGALSWYSTLDNIIGFQKNIWNDLKAKFLEAYAPKYSAKALCICFQDLRQKNDETVPGIQQQGVHHLQKCLPE